MKRIFLLCGLLTAFFLCFADGVEYKQSIPTSGATISSFNFELEFDIEKALVTAEAAKPGNQFGLGYKGGNTTNAKLYKGDLETGELIATTNTSNFTGKSEGFVVNGNKVKVSFDSSIPVLSNQLYTVKIDNTFYLYPSGSAVFVTATKKDFSENPIILTFIGEESSKPQLECLGSNIENGVSIDELKNIEFSLSAPFNINEGAEIQIKEGDNIIASTTVLKVDSSDNKLLVADFKEIQKLVLGHQYTIELPANSLTHVDDSSVGNFVYKVDVNGSHTYKIALSSSKVDIDSNGIPTSVTFIYDIPDGTTLDGMNMTGRGDGLLSVDGSEEYTNLNTKYSFIQNGKGLKWDLSSVKFEPATKYNFTKEGNTLIVFDANNSNISTGLLKEYSGEDASIVFTTPSKEDLGITPITVEKAKVGAYDNVASPDFEDGGTYANIDALEIKRRDYTYNGKNYKTTLNWEGEHNAYIYDVTDGSRKMVKEVEMAMVGRDPDGGGGIESYAYSVFLLNLKMDFLQNHTYEVVIPKGAIRISNTPFLFNYALNDELVYTIKGATPTEFKVESCSVEDGAKVNAVPSAIIWTLNGAYQLKNSEVVAESKSSGTVAGNSKLPVSIQKDGNKSYLAVHMIDTKTGGNYPLRKGQILTVTIPAGSIVYPGDESIANPVLSVSIEGLGAETPKAETVNVNLAVNGLHASAHKAVKGEAYTFHFNPAAEWVVESVQHGDKELAPNADDSYTTEPLNADADITAYLKYNGLWAFEDTTTGIWTVKETDIRIFRDGDKIVVEGITPDNNINVYNIGGLIVNSGRVKDGKDKAYISVPKGQIYIVTVDGVAAKIDMR